MSKKESLDDLLEEFVQRSKNAKSSKKDLWNKKEDDIYNVDIHIWRHTGMGNSIQTIVGNKLSIMTATTSYLQTLLDKEVITESEFDDMVQMIKEVRHA